MKKMGQAKLAQRDFVIDVGRLHSHALSATGTRCCTRSSRSYECVWTQDPHHRVRELACLCMSQRQLRSLGADGSILRLMGSFDDADSVAMCGGNDEKLGAWWLADVISTGHMTNRHRSNAILINARPLVSSPGFVAAHQGRDSARPGDRIGCLTGDHRHS